MTPRLFAFDVDGTLLDSTGHLRPRTAAALQRLRAEGAVIAIATGRPWRVVERTVALVGGADWAVCSNGSKLVEVATGAVHRNVFLPSDVPRAVVESVRADVPGVGFGFEFEDGAKSEAGWDRRLPPGVPIGAPVDDILTLLEPNGSDGESRPLRGIVMYHDDYDDAPGRLVERVRVHVDPLGVEVRATGLPFISVGVAGEHKARSLEVLAATIGITPADAVAFGDENNDLEMVAWAGLGIAMGNGTPEVQAVADLIAPTNDDDGVAQLVERILDGTL